MNIHHKKKILEDKVAIVTGASRGIGCAVAKAYADCGAKVAIVSRNLRDLERAAADCAQPELLFPVQADVSSEPDVARMTDAVLNRFGKIDILVNNAGVLPKRAPLHEVSAGDWDLAMSVNLRGAFLCLKHVLPVMIRRRTGVILNVSSGAGKRGMPEWGAYGVSKFGIEGLTQVASAEVRSCGIRVNAVNPGGVRTAMRAAAYPDENPMLLPSPEEVTPLFIYLVSPETKLVTGQSFDFREWLQSFPERRYAQPA